MTWTLYRRTSRPNYPSIKLKECLCVYKINKHSTHNIIIKTFIKMTTMPTCIICDEKQTQSQTTCCPYCDFNPCRSCVRKYVLNELDIQCMNCKKTWTREHQNVILLPSFVNKQLREHQEKVMYDRETALFPATMDIIEDRRLLDRLSNDIGAMKEKIYALHAQRVYFTKIIQQNDVKIKLRKSIPKFYTNDNIEEIEEQSRLFKIKSNDTLMEIKQCQERERFVKIIFTMTPENRKIVMDNYIEGADPNEILGTLIHTGQITEAKKRVRNNFIRACSVENCRGFLNQQWRCGICNVYTCSKCNIPKTTTVNATSTPDTNMPPLSLNDEGVTFDHVCNPDDVATAELIATDTKPCPQCGTGIFKIDGCDQMWCIECKTAFSWITGKIATGNIHNPHYFEYQRRNGIYARNILDIPCNALRPEQYHGILHDLIRRARLNPVTMQLLPDGFKTKPDISSKAANYSTSLNHYATELLPNYRTDAIQNNLELRVRYLTEQYSLKEFKTALSRESKQFNRKIEIGQVLQTVVFGMSDILSRLIEYLRDDTDNINKIFEVEPIVKIFSEIDALIEYTNECLKNICKQYKLTRIALFIRSFARRRESGLFTVKTTEETLPDGNKHEILVPVKRIHGWG